MKYHLNIFEYYNQKGVLPIENNSTRNLGIVLKNNPLVLFSFIDLISEKSRITITKPTHPDEWFLELQVRIKDLAKEDIEISNVIATTLTTSNCEFYGDADGLNEKNNITDMVIFSKGTLIVIEAKRNNTDATNQLKGQITELKQELKKNGYPNIKNLSFISLIWEDIVDCLNNISILTNEQDVVLKDYLEHIKNSVPSFFPVQTFKDLRINDIEHIKRRIERFAYNYGTDVVLRSKTIEPEYWVKLYDKDYVQELIYENYNESLKLCLFPGNTIGQGRSMYKDKNTLRILSTSSINVDGIELSCTIKPNLKFCDSWAKWKFDVGVNTTDKKTLKRVFKDICGRRNKSENEELLELFNNYKDIISVKTFKENFKESFKNSELNYTFIISLPIGIYFDNMFPVLKKIDNSAIPDKDKVVEFTKKIVQKVYDIIEN